MGLLERIRRGTHIAEGETPPTARAGRHVSLADVAKGVLRGEEPLPLVRDFLDQVGRRSDAELEALIRVEPPLTGRPEVDALLAGLAEHFAAVRGLRCGPWVREPTRFLDRFWFVSDVEGFRAIALAQTPVGLKRRGVLWPARSLERV
jgi:hypothetical protein